MWDWSLRKNKSIKIGHAPSKPCRDRVKTKAKLDACSSTDIDHRTNNRHLEFIDEGSSATAIKALDFGRCVESISDWLHGWRPWQGRWAPMAERSYRMTVIQFIQIDTAGAVHGNYRWHAVGISLTTEQQLWKSRQNYVVYTLTGAQRMTKQLNTA